MTLIISIYSVCFSSIYSYNDLIRFLLDCRSRKEYDESHIISANLVRRVSYFKNYPIEVICLLPRMKVENIKCHGMLISKHVNILFSMIVEQIIYHWMSTVSNNIRCFEEAISIQVLFCSFRWYICMRKFTSTTCWWIDHYQNRTRRLSIIFQIISFSTYSTITLLTKSKISLDFLSDKNRKISIRN